jgi:topoisomerase-4 subunit A
MSYTGLALRFDLAEVPTNGARTAGVKSMNLRDDDCVVNMALCDEGDNIALITTRGAYKEMKLEEIPTTSRARKGVLILRELKTNPHRVADFIDYPASFEGALEIITDRPIIQDVLTNDHPLGSRYSNGSFVLDTDTQGLPISLRRKLLQLVV